MVKLEIFSDPICPWCYIGKTELDRALEKAGNPFEIVWHPFMLNPDMPEGGMARDEYLAAKFGEASGGAAYQQIRARAEAAGVKMDLDKIARTPSTLDAHRLIHWAGIEGHQSFVVQRLFEAYFREGRDIGDREVLADIADAVGLDAAMVQRLFETDSDIDEVRKRDAAAREMGVTGVPTFVVAEAHAVPGAQPSELWLNVIAELTGQEK